MKTSLRQAQVRLKVGAVAFTLLGAALTLNAATTNTPATAKVDGIVVQPPFVEPPIPQSVFVMPKNATEGRDPFFPKSIRPYGVAAIVKKPEDTAPVFDFTLKGISGTADQPLAIINNVNFAVGDELEVSTKAGRTKIRCLEINKDAGTAVIQSGGQRRELRLTPLK